ncbi:hypothetical protein PMAYCL1PPCAC_05960, partial [Pristionchus mayeri]
DAHFLHETGLVLFQIEIKSRRVFVSRRAPIEASVTILELFDNEERTVIERHEVIIGEIEHLVVLGPDDGGLGISNCGTVHLHSRALRRVQLVCTDVLLVVLVRGDDVHRSICMEERRACEVNH